MSVTNKQLVEFLQTEMAIPSDSIALGLRQIPESPNLLPIVLWQYGLVTTHQLDQIFDWLESCPLPHWLDISLLPPDAQWSSALPTLPTSPTPITMPNQ